MLQTADTIVTGGGTGKPPDSPERRWKIRQLVYAEVLAGLDAVFTSFGIKYMPMKGAHLICTNLAGKLRSREMHDIDLLVRPSDFENTLAALENHPQFTREPPDPWDFEQSFLYRHGRHHIHLEIHRALNRPERFTLDTNELFGRATAQTALRRIMSLEDALVVLVCHTLVHLVDGIPEHAFEEASILSGVKGFSWERFEMLLFKTGILRFGRAFLVAAAAKKDLGLPPSMGAHAFEKILFGIRSPGRKSRIRKVLFRGIVELFFVKNAAALLQTLLLKH